MSQIDQPKARCHTLRTLFCIGFYPLLVHGAEGLKVEYYSGFSVVSNVIQVQGLTLVKSEIDTNLDHWNGSQWYDWSPIGGGNYTVRWTGSIFLPETGQYGLGTISDDGSQVWIDGNMVLNNGEPQWYDWQETNIVLNAGQHSFEMRFYDSASYSGIELWWLLPSQAPSDLPYSGDNFHGVPPTPNAGTQWQIISSSSFSTEPPAPGPLLRYTYDPSSQTLALEWDSSTAELYSLEVSEDLKTWNALDSPIPGTGAVITRSRSLGKDAEFFRVASIAGP